MSKKDERKLAKTAQNQQKTVDEHVKIWYF